MPAGRSGASSFGLHAWLYRNKPFPLGAFSRQFAQAPDGFAGLSRSALRWFLVSAAPTQFAKEAFPLKLPLEELQGLVDVIVTDEYLDGLSP
jgi:hypothetical protein